MTKEELIDGLYDIKNWHCDGNERVHSLVTEAIKVLEKEVIIDIENTKDNDLISRQALLKLMGEEPFNWTDSDGELQAVEDYRNFRNMVEQLPSVNSQRWIPVSERFPEEGVDVLACFYTGEKNYKMMVSRRSDYNYWSGVGRTSDMVAWMPLPKPYKKGGETDG